MTTKNSGGEREKTDTAGRVAFELTPAMLEELKRIREMTDLASNPEIFRRAFTLLRIHVEAAARGREIYMVDPKKPGDRYIISLPFTVKQSAGSQEA